jgi:hypothetical protein
MMHSIERWHSLTLAEQLGNVGSEYSRMVRNFKLNDTDKFQSALTRYLELLDFTIEDPRWNLARKRELLRVREVSCENFSDSFQKYFDQFALLARRKNK